ncbi:glycosyltransferase family 2 protein [Staphylococcus pseudoxylosus]|uniref:Glycosyltransferase n=1 Tax=Staphylococcus pseudoxylosus TaxID=2282419 RepID=A0AAQ0MHB7_9STAP|nr:glycosyltransferase family 2 protein [Staphylococcus pseudoxylosus]PTI83747.1 glycosyltransferase [Staphylococcus xylosus]MBM2657994.1 glycosyltransferase family 2 protein [Staphylococcus pseudoxylosus]MCE5001458.1 glycosyltransferase family 2 protein [Staphylococcus pseudoxylosus]MDW8546070.1 glycosyltransferase family 2 protein [Staphylococcus pseudoxylosus]MEB5782855.1 glycosyltransferase family 2 protein [Staphylococcus pseudoxylosus]
MQIRVIVPCYNEGEVIVKTYERLTEILSKDSQNHHYDYDLLFVDDGSKDKTINYIQEMATKDEHVKFISFSRNFGKESAMIAGYQHSENCDGVIMIDADLQHPPELIPQMIEGYMDGYDQVIAKRDRTGEKQSRKMMTKIYYKLINHFVEDIKLEDGVGDFRLLSQRAVQSLTQLDEYNRFSKGLYEWIGYNTKVFTYENVEREDGESKWSFSKLLNYGIDGLISFNNKPLRAMIYLGLIVFFISLLYIGYISVGIMIRGVETPGYFSTIAAILLLGGIQLISIGIVGEYIGRIYYEVKQRPKYIVQASNFKCAHETNHQNITQDINDDVGSSERRKSSKIQDKKKKELIKNR